MYSFCFELSLDRVAIYYNHKLQYIECIITTDQIHPENFRATNHSQFPVYLNCPLHVCTSSFFTLGSTTVHISNFSLIQSITFRVNMMKRCVLECGWARYEDVYRKQDGVYKILSRTIYALAIFNFHTATLMSQILRGWYSNSIKPFKVDGSVQLYNCCSPVTINWFLPLKQSAISSDIAFYKIYLVPSLLSM